MSVWPVVWRVVDALFERAIRLDRWLDEREARKNRGLSFKDVQHQQAQIARATRSQAQTVVLPRPRAVTSPPPAADGAPPTAPTRPGRGR
jgi:hypothetical protein